MEPHSSGWYVYEIHHSLFCRIGHLRTLSPMGGRVQSWPGGSCIKNPMSLLGSLTLEAVLQDQILGQKGVSNSHQMIKQQLNGDSQEAAGIWHSLMSWFLVVSFFSFFLGTQIPGNGHPPSSRRCVVSNRMSSAAAPNARQLVEMLLCSCLLGGPLVPPQ